METIGVIEGLWDQYCPHPKPFLEPHSSGIFPRGARAPNNTAATASPTQHPCRSLPEARPIHEAGSSRLSQKLDCRMDLA